MPKDKVYSYGDNISDNKKSYMSYMSDVTNELTNNKELSNTFAPVTEPK